MLTQPRRKTHKMAEFNSEESIIKTEDNMETLNTCELCDAVFTSKQLFTEHCATCREKKPLVCELCHLLLKDVNELKEHKLIKHQDEHSLANGDELTDDSKDTADEQENDTEQSEEEIENENEEKPHVCNKCSIAFTDLESYTIHMEYHKEENIRICPVCNAAFLYERELAEHVETHAQSSETLESEDIKVQGFMLMHNDVKPFNAENTSPTRLKIILPGFGSVIHPPVLPLSVNKPYKCSECDKSYSTKAHLTRHTRTHGNNDGYFCKQCGESFKTKDELTTHAKDKCEEIDENKRHQCELCNKAFSNKAGLMQHQRVHSLEKTHVCEECGKSFKTKYHLQRHLTTHSSEKPFQCQECNKQFPVAGALKKHLWVCNEMLQVLLLF